MKYRVLFFGLFLAVLANRVCGQGNPILYDSDQPVNQASVLGTSFEFDIGPGGYGAENEDGTFTYQWTKNGVAITPPTLQSLGGASYIVNSSSATNAGTYTCIIVNPGQLNPPAGSITSSNATLTIWYPPVITKQPTNIVAIQGTNVTFTVLVSNLPPTNFTYQWEDADAGYANLYDGPSGYGSTNNSTTNASFTISNVQSADSGDYAVDVNNDTGNDTLSTNVTLSVIVPPIIDSQPASNTNAAQGDDVLFTVAVDPSTTGAGTAPIDLAYPLTYQWQLNGHNISGANTWYYEIPSADIPNNGSYTLILNNYGGSITSAVATLTVFVPPSITIQPADQNVITNTYANLSVTATGTALQYQWYNGNTPIDGATNSTYSFLATSTNLNSVFSVYVYNAVDSIFSADVTVTIQPTFSLPFPYPNALGSVIPGENTIFTNAFLPLMRGQIDVNNNAFAAGSFVALVQVQQNNGTPTNAAITYGGDTSSAIFKWTLTNLTLIPGTNSFLVSAADNYGNQMTPFTRNLIYITPSPFTLLVNGPGTVSSNWIGGNILDIGLNYALAAMPNNGFKLVSWSNNITSSLANGTNLTFTMQSNLVITATFGETNPPAIAINSPAANTRYTNTVTVPVSGTATDNVAVAAVMWQVNGGAWTAASGTTNWTASVPAANGTNLFSAYSVDTANNFSPTNNLTFIYVALDKLTVTTNGQGTLNTNYNGQFLYLGQSYSLTATAATTNGFVFTNWTGGVNGATNVLATTATLNLVMQSNLTVQANFTDMQNPTLTITNALPTTAGAFTVRGTAADNNQVTAVNFQLNNGAWTPATGTNSWLAAVNLVAGTNTFRAYSVDAWGNKSATNSISSTVTIVPSAINISLKLTNNQAQISFLSTNGSTYYLEYKTALTDSAWTALTGSAPGTGSLVTLVDSLNFAPPALRLYRMQAVGTNGPVTAPFINLKLTNGQAQISAASVVGVTYNLSYKNVFSNSVWTPVAGPTNATGSNVTLIDTFAAPAKRFYRVHVTTP